MRFIDEAHIQVSSGAGGNGCRSFRREKFVAFGGPDGGDGGRGGDIVMVATTRRSTLLELKGKTIRRAQRGEHGRGKQQYGKGADSVTIEVPVGTRVFDDDTNETLADLTEHNMSWVAAKGGRGGKGNLHFKTEHESRSHQDHTRATRRGALAPARVDVDGGCGASWASPTPASPRSSPA